MVHAASRLDLFVTEACNLACGYCFASGRGRRDPPLAGLLDAVDWLVRSEEPHVHVTLWGGEPLLRPRVLERVVAHARARAREAGKRLTLSMPTNATLLDDGALDWIRENGIAIFLSLDGDAPTQALRPLASGCPSHEMAYRGMDLALGAGLNPAPAVRMTVAPQTASRLDHDVGFLVARGARTLLVYPAYDRPWSPEQLAAYARSQAALARLLVRWIEASDDPGRLPRLKAWMPVLGRLHEGVAARARSGPVRDCGAGTRLVALDVDGTFFPCHRFVHYARTRGEDRGLGSLEDGPDPGRCAPYADRGIEDLEGVTRCVECDLHDLCTYGCIAINYAATGRLDRIPETACRLVRAGVEACRSVHEALGDDPRYALYLGRPLSAPLARVAGELGRRASEIHRGST
jgi:uncharacterized protein